MYMNLAFRYKNLSLDFNHDSEWWYTIVLNQTFHEATFFTDYISKKELNSVNQHRLYTYMKNLAETQPHLHSRQSEQVGFFGYNLSGYMFNKILKKYY